MADRINLSIVTSQGSVFEKPVKYVNIPTDFGSLGILADHAPMMCAVSKGVVRCSFGDSGSAKIFVSGGVADIIHNQVTLLVSGAAVKTE